MLISHVRMRMKKHGTQQSAELLAVLQMTAGSIPEMRILLAMAWPRRQASLGVEQQTVLLPSLGGRFLLV